MRTLIIGDLHSKKSNIDTIIKILTQCKKLATKCDRTVFCGDLLDGKALIRSESLRLFFQFFSDWPHKIFIIPGNHDMENAISCENHSLEALKLLPKIRILDTPTLIDSFFFVPYMSEDKFKELDFQGDYLFCHQDISGATYSSQTPTNSIIEPSLLSRYKKVFAGHIHLKQSFKNIIYVGTPYTESFKESNEDKSVIIFNDENDKFVEIPLNAPQHRTTTYRITSLDDIPAIKTQLNDTYTFDGNLLLRLILQVPEEIESKIKRSLFSDIPLTAFKTVKIALANKKVSVNEALSNLEMMEMYLNQQGYASDKLTKMKEWNSIILKEII